MLPDNGIGFVTLIFTILLAVSSLSLLYQAAASDSDVTLLCPEEVARQKASAPSLASTYGIRLNCAVRGGFMLVETIAWSVIAKLLSTRRHGDYAGYGVGVALVMFLVFIGVMTLLTIAPDYISVKMAMECSLPSGLNWTMLFGVVLSVSSHVTVLVTALVIKLMGG